MAERKSLVTTVPGIGPITAAIIESELGEAKRFENANQVRAFAGLDPSVYPSGKFDGNHGHISKRGSPRLRKGLYRAALSASRVNPACRELYERLTAKGKAHRSALTAVSAKRLVQSWAVLREGKGFQVPERYRLEEPERTSRTAPSTKKSEESATTGTVLPLAVRGSIFLETASSSCRRVVSAIARSRCPGRPRQLI